MADSGHGAKTRKSEEVIAALLSCSTVAAAAAVCGLHENTVLRMMQDQDFQKKYRSARCAVLDAAIGMLQAASSEAVDCLREILASPNAPASARVTAAKAVLELGARHLEIEDLAQRIDSLESNLAGKSPLRQAGCS